MHKQYAKQGLEIIAVNVDDFGEKGLREKVLKTIPAALKNVHVDLKLEDREKKLRSSGIPIIFIFNQENRYTAQLPRVNKDGETEDFEYKDLNKLVEPLLQPKK